jgi:long-chain fatty acid transport protein
MAKGHKLKLAYSSLTTITLYLLTTASYASGFRVPELSIAGLGTANALVANAEELGALMYNPAGMGFHDGNNIVTGVINIKTDINVTPANGVATGNVGEDTFNIPNFYFMQKIDTTKSWGIGLTVPFGLETEWPDETFAGFAGALDALEPEKSKIEMINLNPNFAYHIDNNTTLAFGLDYYLVREIKLNTQVIGVEGDGDGIGWNVAFMHKSGAVSVGMSFRSEVKTDITGTVSTSPTNSSAATTNVIFPSIFQIGARYQVNNDVAIEFDIDRTGWNSFDEISISHSTAGVSTNPILSKNNWEATYAYRLGGTVQMTPKAQIRWGITTDKTPQGTNFSARVPDSDRQIYSIGFDYDLGNWSIEGAYMVALNENRVENSQKSFTQNGGEANGSNLYNGLYQSKIDLFGIGATFKF